MSSDGRLKRWLKKKLGINSLDYRLQRLEEIEHFTLANVVDKLSESFMILTDKNQLCIDNHITVPFDKSGVILLGEKAIVSGCVVDSQLYKITKEPL